MEPKKYWWIRYKNTTISLGGNYEKVIDVHPFLYCNQPNMKLQQWQLISVEEYNLFQELNNKQ